MMNCETIDAILDDHLAMRLTATERQRAAEHMQACARCFAAWVADDALRADGVADPSPKLFPALVRGLASSSRSKTAARGGWPWLATAAAGATIAAVLAVRFAVVEPSTAPAVSSDSPAAAASRFVAGRDYEVLPGAAARAGASDAIEVTEFFMFLCFPCYSLEPALDSWEVEAASDVSLTRVPAMFNAAAELQARAFYTAEALGKLGAMQDAFYAEIHERGNPLASRAALAALFARFDVDATTFDAMFDSSEVDARMRRAIALNREYGIRATPTIVVDGRYATTAGRGPQPFATMLAVVDQLVAERRACQHRCVEPSPR